MTPDRLAEIRARADAAMLGPWDCDDVPALCDLVKNLITALEAAQERIATLEAEVIEIDDLREENLHLAGINIGADREILRLKALGALLNMQQAWQALK